MTSSTAAVMSDTAVPSTYDRLGAGEIRLLHSSLDGESNEAMTALSREVIEANRRDTRYLHGLF